MRLRSSDRAVQFLFYRPVVGCFDGRNYLPYPLQADAARGLGLCSTIREFEPRGGLVCRPVSPSINLMEPLAGCVRSRRKLDH